MSRNKRRISKTKGIGTPSLPEVREAARVEAERLADDRGMKGDTRRVEPGYLMNWLLLWYIHEPPGERDRIAAEGKAILDHLLASPTRLQLPLDDPPRPGDDRPESAVVGPVPPVTYARGLGGIQLPVPDRPAEGANDAVVPHDRRPRRRT